VYVKVGNNWDTDDIVSDIFRKAYEKFATVEGNYAPWIFTIARNSIVDFYRQKKEIAASEEMEEYTSKYIHQFSFNNIEDAEAVWEKENMMSCLKKSLAYLKPEEQELIVLRYFADMKYDDIGLLLNKSGNSVKMKVFRIIKKLKVLLTKCMEG